METAVINPISAGDTAWVLISSALVMLMTPGLAFFYGGMVRRKNVLGVLMQCMGTLALVSVLWVLYGYSLAFGKGSPFIGGLEWLGLNGVGQEAYADYSATIPHLAFMIFQAMFAVITPALIIGAFAERVKFSAFIAFTVLWLTLVYAPICHMVWAVGGWVRGMGALDFAGGTVVHINAGVAGLVTALFVGKRIGIDKPSLHNIPFVVLGGALLWFGWFGFNAGSALAANGLAASAFVVHQHGRRYGSLDLGHAGMDLQRETDDVRNDHGRCRGVGRHYAGLRICRCFRGIPWIGALVSVFCYFVVSVVKPKLGYDDSLDAFGVHGIGGFWGAIATGIFATKAVNSAGADGLLAGNAAQLWIQFKAAGITVVYCAIVTWIICFIVDKTIGMRVKPEHESMGLDLTQHHERAYTMIE